MNKLKVSQKYFMLISDLCKPIIPNHISITKYFNYLPTETNELLEKEAEPMDESNDDPTICGEESIEHGELLETPRKEIDCFLCDEHFNSISNLDEHLYSKHPIDRDKHAAYWKWQSNEVPKTAGKNWNNLQHYSILTRRLL